MRRTKLLLELSDPDIDGSIPERDVTSFRHRQAARGVVFDVGRRVALLHVGRADYYKLPGGGLEPNEDHEQALHREVSEELGCDIEIVGQVGTVIEHRYRFSLTQHSYCYLAQKTGEDREPSLTESELADGFEIVWADDLVCAARLVDGCTPSDYEGQFIRRRDLLLLQAAVPLLQA